MNHDGVIVRAFHTFWEWGADLTY